MSKEGFMKHTKYIILSLLVIISCSTYDLKINSEPKGAKVYIKSEKEKTEVGVTPMVLAPQYKNADAYQFIIEKDGFHPQTVVIEKRSFATEAEVFANLKKIETLEVQLNDPKVKGELQKVTRKVASIQSELIKRNYTNAEGMAKDLLNEYPYFAVGWNLLGNSYYLQNKHSDALGAYKRALEFEPENMETKNLIQSMENLPFKGDRND